MAAWFGYAGVFGKGEPKVSFYCCNLFAATPAGILRTNRSTWNEVYQSLVVNGTCHPLLQNGSVQPDRDHGTHEGGGAFEMLAALIWGGADGAAEYAGPNWRQLFGG